MQVWYPSVILAAPGHAPAAVRAGPQRLQQHRGFVAQLRGLEGPEAKREEMHVI